MTERLSCLPVTVSRTVNKPRRRQRRCRKAIRHRLDTRRSKVRPGKIIRLRVIRHRIIHRKPDGRPG